ncbi:hypothetical protein [Streptomyces sp. NPDC001389]|uniref:hypothetical protein n=1 Tax=Streptomyces sp. NPDC001389 TaxID=3364569 RepID=UPI00367B9CD9
MKTPLRIVCATAVAVLSVAACDSIGGGGGDQGKARNERDTAVAYVKALNDRDPQALAKLGPPGNAGTEEEAQKLIAAQGGRKLQVDDVRVSHEFGPDTADAQVRATDDKGQPVNETLTLTRKGKSWYVVLGTNPGGTQKTPAQTSRPSPTE